MIFSGDLVSTKEDETYGQDIENKRGMLEQDQCLMQIPIRFLGNENAEMVSMNDCTTLTDRLPNTILESIINCSQSPIFSVDRRCRSLCSTGSHLGVLNSTIDVFKPDVDSKA